jgi:hypothetical protein
LTEAEQRIVERARRTAFLLYEGKRAPHRSCGIAVAEVFGLPTRPYQSLRKGGITGEGECGAIKAGELILGELLGDPSPTGAITAVLREAAAIYRRLWLDRFDLGPGARTPDGNRTIICNDLIRPHGDFHGPARHGYCTVLAAEVAALACEVLLRCGYPVALPSIDGLAPWLE